MTKPKTRLTDIQEFVRLQRIEHNATPDLGLDYIESLLAENAELTKENILACEKILTAYSSKNKTMEENKRLTDQLENMTALLKAVVCPECDGSGIYGRQICEEEWEQVQCHWCFDKKALTEPSTGEEK